MSEHHAPRFSHQFGPFRLDSQAGELHRDDEKLRLQEKPLTLLLALLERPGEIVDREELCTRLWPDGSHVDFEHGLGNALHKLREALGDSAAHPRYIETIPRRGYRFLRRVERLDTRAPEPRAPIRPSWAAAVVALAIALGWWALATWPGRLAQPPLSEDWQAREAYLRGEHFLQRKTSRDLQRSVENLRQAIERDPQFAQAWASLAYAYHFLGAVGVLPPQEAFQRASESARAALGIDGNLAKAHAVLAETTYRFGPPGPAAQEGFERALALDPSSAEIRHWYGAYLSETGRLQEGLAELRAAHRLDPLSLHTSVDLALNLYLADQREQALEQLQRTRELDPRYPKTHYLASLIASREGRFEEAVSEMQRVVELAPDVPKFIYALAKVCLKAGRRREAERAYTRLASMTDRYVPPELLRELQAGLAAEDSSPSERKAGR
ncbi:MAG TPA: winged helix-turn-helix domain-containing protein [Acidobacteriota bacterium]|nr:winged helix-turn-helix domain-containing protein [Acidobacteriota bacterium]